MWKDSVQRELGHPPVHPCTHSDFASLPAALWVLNSYLHILRKHWNAPNDIVSEFAPTATETNMSKSLAAPSSPYIYVREGEGGGSEPQKGE